MKPIIHAQNSVNKYGGTVEDYLPIHNFIDSSKIAYAGLAHRAILHNTFGIFLAQEIHGDYIVNSDCKKVSVRQIAEEHIFEDLGFIPTIEDWMKELPIKTWMQGMAAASKEMRRVENLSEVLKRTKDLETKIFDTRCRAGLID